jgi:hypothetical protein
VTLTRHDIGRLKEAGFLDSEVKMLDNAVDPAGNAQKVDLSVWSWKAAIQSRKNWVKDKKTRGWSIDHIRDALMGYYRRDTKRSPFDFVNEQYRNGMTGRRITDYQVARAKRKDAEIKRALTGYKVAK